MNEIEAIAQKIDELVVRSSHELADRFAHNFSVKLDNVAFAQERFVEDICIQAAKDVLVQFPKLNRSDRLMLKNRAISAGKKAFKIRLMQLGRGRL